MSMGRPSDFTQETADAICDRLCAGESLRKICSDDDMPDQTTVYRWLRNFEDFRQQYTRARETQAETIFDEMLDIADGVKELTDEKDVQRDRLAIDARKWVLGKLAPKKYGEKVDLNLSGNLGITKAAELSDDELAKMASGK